MIEVQGFDNAIVGCMAFSTARSFQAWQLHLQQGSMLAKSLDSQHQVLAKVLCLERAYITPIPLPKGRPIRYFFGWQGQTRDYSNYCC